MKEFQAVIEKRRARLSANAIYQQTDLIVALRLAQEETANLTARKCQAVVIVLSDLVHSTAQIRFETDGVFANAESSRRYAGKSGTKGEWRNAEIYPGSLESSDLRKMSLPRREAVREFWREYFKIGGAKRIQFATDGARQMAKFIKSAPTSEER